MSSVVVAYGLRCPATCGILVPQPGIKSASPALEGRFFTTGPPGKSLVSYFRFILFMVQNYCIYISYLTPYLWLAFSHFRALCLPGFRWTDWTGVTTLTSWGQREAPCPGLGLAAWVLYHHPQQHMWQLTISVCVGSMGLGAELSKLFVTKLVPDQKYWLFVM